jgi:hypothetical protein
MLLDAEFRALSQGALSIDDYCHKMKSMAHVLADLGEPIQDRALVLNVLRGLNERFAFMANTLWTSLAAMACVIVIPAPPRLTPVPKSLLKPDLLWQIPQPIAVLMALFNT